MERGVKMVRFPAWLQAGLLGLAVLLAGAVGVLAMSGQLQLSSLQGTWKLTVLHTNDVSGYIDPCG
jgi:2',3'-cyclic-nucleotide 2'-phosphodiesterase (5'-nucleotidase family)